MVSLYIKILKKTITDTELVVCQMPYILDEIDKPRRDWLKKSGVNYIVQILKENFIVGTMSRKRTHKIDKF